MARVSRLGIGEGATFIAHARPPCRPVRCALHSVQTVSGSNPDPSARAPTATGSALRVPARRALALAETDLAHGETQ